MVKIARPSNLMLGLNIVLCIFALTSTIYALNGYLQWQQTITQHVSYAVVNVNVKNYSLPNGYVGFGEFSDTVLTLEFTTQKPNLTLIITCNNTTYLQSKYTVLTLTLLNSTTGQPLESPAYVLNLLSPTSRINYPLSAIDTYDFGYRFNYNPTTPSSGSGDNKILLDVAFLLVPSFSPP